MDTKTRANLLGSGSMIAAMLLSAAAGAAEAPIASSAVTEVIVTAQRRDERLKDVPLSVTALSQSALAAGGVNGLKSLENITPGLSLPLFGAFMQPTIRGIGTTVTTPGNDPNVSIYVDGVYMPNQIANVFDLVNVESVQVLKGPQGTLFGRNATGGAILIKTLDPAFDAMHVKADASYASFNEVKLRGYVSMPLSDKVAVNISGLFRKDDGYVRDFNTGAHLATGRETALRGKVKFLPTENLTVTASLDYDMSTDNQSYALRSIDGNLLVHGSHISPDPREVSLSFAPQIKTRSIGGSLDEKLDLGPATLSAITSYRRSTGFLYTDSDRTEVANNSSMFGDFEHTFTQELNLASNNKEGTRWITGLYAYIDNSDMPFLRSNLGPNLLSSKLATQAYAVFAEVTQPIGEKLTITGGLRGSYERKKFSRYSPASGAAPPPLDKDSWSSLTPRLSALYELTDHANTYLTLSRGFKSGGYNSQSLAIQKVKPETLDAIEVGYKFAAPGMSFNAAVFHYRYKDVQVQASAPNSTSLSILQNAASAKSYGAEAEFIKDLGYGLDVRLGAAYTHARYGKFPAATVTIPNPPNGNILTTGNASGLWMIRTPEWKLDGTLHYVKPVSFGTIDSSVTATYTSKFYWNFNNRLSQSSYVLINGRIGLRLPGDHVTVAVFAQNLTNKLYAQYVADTIYTDAVAYARPRTVGASVSVDW